jgi:CBS domain-containing protein
MNGGRIFSHGNAEGLSIVDPTGNLEGIITRSDILRAFEKDSDGKMSVLETATRDVMVTYPDKLLHRCMGLEHSQNC